MATRCHLLFYKPFIDKMGLFGIKRVFGKGKKIVVFLFSSVSSLSVRRYAYRSETNDLPAPPPLFDEFVKCSLSVKCTCSA